ncbi:MAG TPA: phospholipid carrier-dependent glycosyltransferase [Candidatus Eisenbacteria bacterium]
MIPAWALAALALVLSAGVLGLIEPTETRYAEIGREMLATRDWLIPRLNGIAHFHKPPLAYWASAGGMAVAGVNEWGARIGAALAGAFLLWCTARIARRHAAATAMASLDASDERARGVEAMPGLTAAVAPLLLASTLLFFALSHQLASDIFLAACVGGFYAAYFAPEGRGRVWTYVALGAGFMAKGPVVFVHTLVPLVVLALLRRDRALLRPLGSRLGWLVFALIALPWYLIAVARTPGLVSYFLGNQLWERYATTIHRRPGPWYYFLPVVLAGAIPWTVAAIAGARRAVRGQIGALLVAWLVVPVLFFSTSGSKLPAYVLPEFPALAIVAAAALAARGRIAAYGTAALLAALAAVIEIAGPRGLARAVGATHAATLPLPPLAHVATAAFAVAAIACLYRSPRAACLVALLGFYGLLGAAKTAEGPLGSPKALAGLLERAHGESEPIVEIGAFNAGIPFYLGERVHLVDVPRDVDFDSPEALRQEMLPATEIPRMVKASGIVWVLAPAGRAERAADSLGLRIEPVARWRGSELVAFVK